LHHQGINDTNAHLRTHFEAGLVGQSRVPVVTSNQAAEATRQVRKLSTGALRAAQMEAERWKSEANIERTRLEAAMGEIDRLRKESAELVGAEVQRFKIEADTISEQLRRVDRDAAQEKELLKQAQEEIRHLQANASAHGAAVAEVQRLKTEATILMDKQQRAKSAAAEETNRLQQALAEIQHLQANVVAFQAADKELWVSVAKENERFENAAADIERMKACEATLRHQVDEYSVRMSEAETQKAQLEHQLLLQLADVKNYSEQEIRRLRRESNTLQRRAEQAETHKASIETELVKVIARCQQAEDQCKASFSEIQRLEVEATNAKHQAAEYATCTIGSGIRSTTCWSRNEKSSP
jgi:chromosome segregation ATPase